MEGAEAVGEEQRAVVLPRGPLQPTAEEIAEHEATGHVTHRSWCPHRVRARATIHPHFQAPVEPENALPGGCTDY